MNTGLQKKTVLITGSTEGIGLATARLLAQEGAVVYLNGRTEEHLDEVLENIRQDMPAAKVEGVAADFAKPAEVAALLDKVPEVDILLNNVALFAEKELAAVSDEEWLTFFQVNVMSGVRLSRHYLPKMLAKHWGRIIFTSSESAINIMANNIPYGTTKAAVLALSRGLAEMTKGTAVTVNSVLPGPTKTEKFADYLQHMAQQQHQPQEEVEKQFFAQARPTSLLQRFTSPTEIAHLLVYLASELSSATNGAALRADGGVVKAIC